jgi:hypothetical protein
VAIVNAGAAGLNGMEHRAVLGAKNGVTPSHEPETVIGGEHRVDLELLVVFWLRWLWARSS